MKFNQILSIFLILWAQACSSFRNTPQMIRKQPVRETVDSVRLHMVGWNFYGQHGDSMRKSILASGLRQDKESKYLLEVRLIEKERLYLDYHFFNVLAFIYTAGLIPIYDGINHRLEFRLYKEQKRLSICSLQLVNHQLTGIILLPLTPFFYPSSQQRELFKQSFLRYRRECLINSEKM